MALTPEWRVRIDLWRNELPRHFYRPLGTLPLEGFTTTEQLTAEEAATGSFAPTPAGTRWGAKWEYGWFRGELALPDDARGKRIVLKLDFGGESAVYVNGTLAGAIDKQHTEITLTTHAEPGARYSLLAEAYAGHGPRNAHAGPTPPGRESVPEPGPTQAVVGENSFGIWEEEVFQLWMDVESLYSLRDHLDPDSLRVAEIDRGLKDFTTIVDFEVPREEMMATIRAGRERLQPLLACVNGSTAPEYFAFGHAHLDVAWLWPLQETERKIGRTTATQLALMAEYPDFRYLQSQAHLFWMLKRRHPELYARMKQAVAAGQFIPDGGMWVEADTNISGGESLIRQFIHGKRFFREEFGVDSQVLWLPDVFGYSGNMPQIMQGCGIKYFSTAKLTWLYPGGEPFPYNTFMWEGIDGTQVLSHIYKDYNGNTSPGTLVQRWKERQQKDNIATRIYPYGHGDGGGGVTRVHLEYLRRVGDLEGTPRVRSAAPVDFFRDLEARGLPKNRYVGELYFAVHRGTYTSQARTKQGNRKSEFALREAELWGAAARALNGYDYPLEAMDEAWKTVLLNQFHDIIPGSSIHRVYEEAEAAYAGVIDTAEEVAAQAAASLTDDAPALTVFNSLSWERTALVTLPEDVAGVAGENGESLPVQEADGEVLAEVTIPACGWTTLRTAAPAVPGNTLRAEARLLENDLLRVEFNDRGEISSIYDKETGRDFAAGPCNRFRMYKDVPGRFDAWDIDSQYALTPVELPETASFEVVATGPLVATIRVSRRLHDSTLTQEINLRRGSRRVELATTVDWQESHKLLKVAFPVSIHANEAVHEIQFGHLHRPNHQSRQFDADRFEVANQKWSALLEENRGFAVLNDCKYGLNVVDNSINLTLLKSALAPDMTADKGIQEFTYAFYAWNGCFADCEVVREAYELNVPVMTVSGAAGEASLFSIDAPNVIIDTVKPAEDGSGDVIVRLYEAKRMATRCTLAVRVPFARAGQTDMLENEQGSLPHQGESISLEFRPFEVKTVRLYAR